MQSASTSEQLTSGQWMPGRRSSLESDATEQPCQSRSNRSTSRDYQWHMRQSDSAYSRGVATSLANEPEGEFRGVLVWRELSGADHPHKR